MVNLAGVEDCDKVILRELTRARVPIVAATDEEKKHTEVPFAIVGSNGQFRFRRAWAYWVVTGPVPLVVARELYDDPVGKSDVRVAGHCACPPPEEWVTWRAPDGRIITPTEDYEKLKKFAEISPPMQKYLGEYVPGTITADRAVTDAGRLPGSGFIETYHVDTEVGLRLLVDTLRRHDLLPVP